MPKYVVTTLLQKSDGYHLNTLMSMTAWTTEDLNAAKGKAIIYDMDKNPDYNLVKAIGMEINNV